MTIQPLLKISNEAGIFRDGGGQVTDSVKESRNSARYTL